MQTLSFCLSEFRGHITVQHRLHWGQIGASNFQTTSSKLRDL